MPGGINGRPRKEIDWGKLETVCQYPLTNEDIATILGLSVDTISRAIFAEYQITFAEYKARKHSTLRFALFAKQLEMALAGDKTLLIWLGKQYLGQTEKIEQHINVLPQVTTISMFEKDAPQIAMGARLIESKKE